MKTQHVMAVLALFLVLCAPASGLEAGDQAPEFQLPGLPAGESPVALADFRNKVLYLDFWASWCGPCRLSLPALDRIYAELGEQGFEVLAINVDEVEADALAFLEKYPVSYTVAADPAGVTPSQYGILGMPTAFFIDRQGRVRGVHAGFRRSDEATVRTAIMELLAE
jgi:thiol-disulfide isomerase/thioredoxin